jgi:alkanesulfonate monooxygenase SsuD/methylene tetrahydromethanopterin reductase-like flavin-dependent oxidoreductase (luciferase family)
MRPSRPASPQHAAWRASCCGNNTTLVGTAEQVVDSLLEYYKLGVRGFLLRGYEIMEDATMLGRSVIPLLRRRVAELDAAMAAVGQPASTSSRT